MILAQMDCVPCLKMMLVQPSRCLRRQINQGGFKPGLTLLKKLSMAITRTRPNNSVVTIKQVIVCK